MRHEKTIFLFLVPREVLMTTTTSEYLMKDLAKLGSLCTTASKTKYIQTHNSECNLVVDNN